MENTITNKLSNEDYESLIAKNFKKAFVKEKTIVSGKVISVENDLVTIDVGFKSEGRVPLSEFHRPGQKPEISIGDSYEVFIENVDNANGETTLSREKAIKQKSWNTLQESFDNNKIVTGIPFNRVKGGMSVDLDGVVDFLASPLYIGSTSGTLEDSEEEIERKPDDNEPFSALAFKIMTDPYVGKLTFFRVYSGTISTGDFVFNPNSGQKERVGRLMLMHSNKREERKTVTTGEIAAVVGLKNTKTGHTLCATDKVIQFESMSFPEPVISVAVEASSKKDQENLTTALVKLSDEDPTFRVATDTDTGQTIISGMGELHLEIIVDRLKREFNVVANIGAPQVAYKECITQSADQDTKFAKQSGGRGQYGHVVITIEENGPGEGYTFINKIVGGAIPKEYIPAVDKGIQEALSNGPLAGYPIEDIKVTLTYGSYHDVDSSEMAFKIAGSMAIKAAVLKAKPKLMEPIMDLEVVMPDDYLGDVMGDITSRRGMVKGFNPRNNTQVLDAEVPLSEMFGYATDLRSLTQGRAVFTMQFGKYANVPQSIQETIVEKFSGKVNV